MVFLVKVKKSEYNIVIEKKIEKYIILKYLFLFCLYPIFIPSECFLIKVVRKKKFVKFLIEMSGKV